MNDSVKSIVFSNSLEACQRFLIDRTVTLFDYKSSFRVATGTIFKIEDKVLIATAGHVIVGNPTGRIWPVTEAVRHEQDGFQFTLHLKDTRLSTSPISKFLPRVLKSTLAIECLHPSTKFASSAPHAKMRQ